VTAARADGLRLVVVEQQPNAPAGLVGEWAAARGARVETLRAPEVDGWPDPGEADAIVALGSERSVHASDDPWIAAQLQYLRAAHEARVPVLGICFGAQALAAALGGTVARAATPEVGWIEIPGVEGYGGRWFTWHEDAFTLPPDATELARNARGPQAFALGASVGVQFHPEVTTAIVDGWLAKGRDAVADPEGLRRQSARELEALRERSFALFDAFAAPLG
jgi:GMP synthase-like glutamine amidotransferase